MAKKEKNMLFDDFPMTTTGQWEEKIQADLKGADYEKKLIWNTIDGLKIRPYYRSEDNEKLEHTKTLPGEYPFVRGKLFKNNDWKIRQDIDEKDACKANKEALNALEKGAEAIGFNALSITDNEQIGKILQGISLQKTPVSFIQSMNYNNLMGQLLEFISEKNLNLAEIQGSFSFDPLGYFILYGSFYGTAEKNFQNTADLLAIGKKYLPSYKLINISGQHYHEAGASIVQEVAFALSQGNEYLAKLTDMGVAVEEITPRMQFTFSTGSNYFMEIAKIRAFRMLWAIIVKQYKPESDKFAQTYIHALTSKWNKTIYDHYVNILRSTTEIMAATIAGVDSMTVNPFDITFKKPDDFSKRIARNQQIILKHESYFNKVADAAAGSYYVEQLTDAIASKAWDLFKNIENNGGFIKAAEKSFIYEEIEKTCQKRDMNIAMRKQVFVGTNQYPNTQEKMLDKIQPTAKLSDIGGLKPYRGALTFEAMRLATENYIQKGFKAPKVFLFTYGNPTMRKARAGFTTNFFGCAGYEIIENPGFNSIEQGVEAALKANAEIVVLCSSDEEYGELTEASKLIKEKAENTIVIVAGYPKDILQQLQEAGVDDFINIKTNVLEALTRYNEKLQIN